MNRAINRAVNRTMIFATIAVLMSYPVLGASPASIEQGRQLFEKNWTHGNPAISSDGLGPLFNAKSCVACHNQGGVGGAGDSRFNAKTIGIESINISGGPITSDDVVKSLVSTFHPGFVGSNGLLTNTLSLSHHGGSPLFQKSRTAMMSQIDSRFSVEGGSLTPAEVRRASATPILFNNQVDGRAITIRARLFQRNTSPLFGIALIDKIDGRLIEEQARIQKNHTEISGRPSTLSNGRYGRFGWRGNIVSLLDFVDQACAVEVGLETARKEQPADPMNRDYRNTSVDIKDNQIMAMRDFSAALPSPTKEIPSDSYQREMAARGEQVFASIGCAVCHVPDMGPAKGIYSDILLHDMGYESIDLNHAEPYITRITPTTRFVTESVSRTTGSGAYYGGARIVSIDTVTTSSSDEPFEVKRRQSSNDRLRSGFSFVAPSRPTEKMTIVTVSSEEVATGQSEKRTDEARFRDGRFLTDGDFTVRTRSTTTRERNARLHFEHTNFNQEWRTPPLWGVRDSAPYMHDGRAETLLEAIAMHDGESAGTRDRFLKLPLADRHALIAFLNTLAAPKNVPKFKAD